MSTIMGKINVTSSIDRLAMPTQQTWLLDVLDQRFLDLIESVKSWRPYLWRGEKLTTLCYQAYGVQNFGFIVLAFNGLSSPMQLRHGMVLRMPSKTDIDAFLSSLSKSLNPGVAGKRITI
jgi:hypothetical protein